jgi:hypothetical protein
MNLRTPDDRLLAAAAVLDEWKAQRAAQADTDGNIARQNHVDRCWCGCKYWENDRCIDCGGTEPATA